LGEQCLLTGDGEQHLNRELPDRKISPQGKQWSTV
jgi:hypothetical protein